MREAVSLSELIFMCSSRRLVGESSLVDVPGRAGISNGWTVLKLN